MATFIEIHTHSGASRINIDHVVRYGSNINQDRTEYPGYILFDRAMMQEIHTEESYDQIYKLIYEAQTGCRL